MLVSDTQWDVLIAAAGESKRMGRCKALLEIESTTFVENLVDQYGCAGFKHIWVTIPDGVDGEEIASRISNRAICIPNRFPACGLHGSVLSFLQVSNPNHGVLLTPVDAPFVFPKLVHALQRAVNTSAAQEVSCAAIPVYQQQRGHPVAFSASSRPLFEHQSNPREVIEQLEPNVFNVTTEHPEVLLNINDSASYETIHPDQ